MASAQLPPMNSLPRGEARGVWVSTSTVYGELIGAISLFQAWGTLSRGSYQPIVLTSLWSRLWSPAANYSNFNLQNAKGFIKQINCAHIDIFQKKWYWCKIRMEFLRPILAKIYLICQQPAMTRPIGVKGVLSPAVGCWIGWLGADAVFWVWRTISACCLLAVWLMFCFNGNNN